MAVTILENSGVDITFLDGARFNRFCAGYRDGIIKGSFKELEITLLNSSGLFIDKGELLISGFRVISEDEEWHWNTLPTVPTRYQIIGQLSLNALTKEPRYYTTVREAENLKQENLFEDGIIYQVEIARLTVDSSGITDFVQTLDVITGGDADGAINIGNVVTEQIDATFPAEVDVNNRYDEQQGKTYTDFTFHIPVPSEVGDLAALRTQVTNLQNSFDNLDKTYATDAELEDLGSQITALQNTINNLDSTYATDNELAELDIKLSSSITSTKVLLKKDISDLQTTLNNLDSTYATDAEVSSKIKNMFSYDADTGTLTITTE